MTIDLIIKPGYIRYSNENIGKITLMEHQKEVRDSDEKLIILDAPTSSGKTLAILARFVKTEGDGIFLYPTNELIKDQAKGIKELLDKIGVTSKIIPMEGEIENIDPDCEIIIAVVTGESLEGLANTKGEIINKILHMVKGNRRLLILTNVDNLLILFKMQYKGGKKLLSEFLMRDYSILAIDELHLYSGVAFANLFYITWLLKNKFKQIIISSATLSESVTIFKEVFKEYKVVCPKVLSEHENDDRKIRYEVKLTLVPSNNIQSNEDINDLLMNVKSIFNPNSSVNIDTLIILNSVALSEIISDYLQCIYGREKVGIINGLIPSDLRKSNLLTIGTSAVEVGIDFDLNNLIFEGTNAGSFIQRLGRIGRHRNGTAIGYIPIGAYQKLSKFLEENESNYLTISELSEYADKAIPHLENYTNFTKSIYGAVLFIALLYKIEKESLIKYNLAEIRKGIEKSWYELRPPFFIEEYFKEVLKITNKNVMDIISEGGARGDILTIPVFLKKYGVYSKMNILDLTRTNFYFDQTEKINVKKPSWVTSNEIVVIESFAEKSVVKGVWDGPLLNRNTKKILYATTIGDDTTLNLYLENENLKNNIIKLLNRKIAFSTTTSKLTDWRFPRIYNLRYKGLCLIIGLDALIQQYVEASYA